MIKRKNNTGKQKEKMPKVVPGIILLTLFFLLSTQPSWAQLNRSSDSYVKQLEKTLQQQDSTYNIQYKKAVTNAEANYGIASMEFTIQQQAEKIILLNRLTVAVFALLPILLLAILLAKNVYKRENILSILLIGNIA